MFYTWFSSCIDRTSSVSSLVFLLSRPVCMHETTKEIYPCLYDQANKLQIQNTDLV